MDKRGVFINGVYRHFKGGTYRVIGVAAHTETGGQMVLYRSTLDKNNTIWARLYEEFLSKVDRAKYPDTTQEFRFELLEEKTPSLKPCPFCGGKAKARSEYSTVYDRIFGVAQCSVCGVKVHGKKSFDTYDVNTSAEGFKAWRDNAHTEAKNSAVAVWNRRADHG